VVVAVGPRYVKPTTSIAPFHNLAAASATKPPIFGTASRQLVDRFRRSDARYVVQRALDQNLDLAAALPVSARPKQQRRQPERNFCRQRIWGYVHSRASERCE